MGWPGGVGDVAFPPVRLFSLHVERNEPSPILLRCFVVSRSGIDKGF